MRKNIEEIPHAGDWAEPLLSSNKIIYTVFEYLQNCWHHNFKSTIYDILFSIKMFFTIFKTLLLWFLRLFHNSNDHILKLNCVSQNKFGANFNFSFNK